MRLHPSYFDGTTDPARHDAVVARYFALVEAEDAAASKTPPVRLPDLGNNRPDKPESYRLGIADFPGAGYLSAEGVAAFTAQNHKAGLGHTQTQVTLRAEYGHRNLIERVLSQPTEDGINDLERLWESHMTAIGVPPERADELPKRLLAEEKAARANPRRTAMGLDPQEQCRWFQK